MDSQTGPRTRGSSARPASAVVALLTTALIAACGAQPMVPGVDEAARTEPPPARTCVPAIHGDLRSLDPADRVVTLWHPYHGALEALILEMVDEFNRANPSGIRVLAESQSDPTQLNKSIAAGAAAGRVPDLSMLPSGQIATYAAEGVLAPMDCYAADLKWGYTQATRDDFFVFALDAGFIPQLSARYGWPFHNSAEVLYYNDDWLAELGFESPPETWEEFTEMACAASQQPFSDSRGEGAATGYAYSVDSRLFAALVLSRGGLIANEDNSAYAFGGQEGLDTLEFLKDVAGRGCATRAIVRGDERVDFGAGRALFNVAPVHLLPRYQQAVEEGAGFDWSITPPPHPADLELTPLQIYGPSFAIFRSSPERQLAAWVFVRWLNAPEQQARWATGTSYYPTRREAIDLMADYRAENPQYDAALGFTGGGYSNEPAVAEYDECRAGIEQMLVAVLAGGDARAALSAAVERCDADLRPVQ